MKQVVIENPVVNSPFEESRRHFLFSDEGITNEILEARRVSSYFVPIAKLKKKSKQKKKLGTQESSFFSGFPVSILPPTVSQTVPFIPSDRCRISPKSPERTLFCFSSPRTLPEKTSK